MQQLERRISLSQLGEGLDRGTGGNGEVALHLALEGIEIGFQDLQLLIAGKRPKPKLLARTFVSAGSTLGTDRVARMSQRGRATGARP